MPSPLLFGSWSSSVPRFLRTFLHRTLFNIESLLAQSLLTMLLAVDDRPAGVLHCHDRSPSIAVLTRLSLERMKLVLQAIRNLTDTP